MTQTREAERVARRKARTLEEKAKYDNAVDEDGQDKMIVAASRRGKSCQGRWDGSERATRHPTSAES